MAKFKTEHTTLTKSKKPEGFYPFQSWLRGELEVSEIKSPSKKLMKIDFPRGEFLKKVKTTQLKYPIIPKDSFGLRRTSCPIHNIESISSSLHEDDNSLLSSEDNNLKVNDYSKESIITE